MKDGDKDGADSGSNDIVKRGGDGICGDGVMRRALEHPCREVPALYTTTSTLDLRPMFSSTNIPNEACSCCKVNL